MRLPVMLTTEQDLEIARTANLIDVTVIVDAMAAATETESIAKEAEMEMVTTL